MLMFPDPTLHPQWCSPDYCTAADALLLRGRTVPAYAEDEHRSVRRIITSRPGGTEYTVSVTKDVNEPIDEGELYVELVIRGTDRLFVAAFYLDPEQTRPLADALDWAATAVETRGGSL